MPLVGFYGTSRSGAGLGCTAWRVGQPQFERVRRTAGGLAAEDLFQNAFEIVALVDQGAHQ